MYVARTRVLWVHKYPICIVLATTSVLAVSISISFQFTTRDAWWSFVFRDVYIAERQSLGVNINVWIMPYKCNSWTFVRSDVSAFTLIWKQISSFWNKIIFIRLNLVYHPQLVISYWLVSRLWYQLFVFVNSQQQVFSKLAQDIGVFTFQKRMSIVMLLKTNHAP